MAASKERKIELETKLKEIKVRTENERKRLKDSTTSKAKETIQRKLRDLDNQHAKYMQELMAPEIASHIVSIDLSNGAPEIKYIHVYEDNNLYPRNVHYIKVLGNESDSLIKHRNFKTKHYMESGKMVKPDAEYYTKEWLSDQRNKKSIILTDEDVKKPISEIVTMLYNQTDSPYDGLSVGGIHGVSSKQ